MAAPHPILESYTTYLDDTDKSSATSAIMALTDDIRRSTATTMMGLRDELRQAGEVLKSCPDAPISIGSLCELFVRFVTRIQMQMEDLTDFEAVKRLLVERGETFARTSLDARTQIAQLGAPLIDDGAVVLTHGYSRVLVALFLTAAKTKHFSVMVAESHPDGAGHTTARMLIEKGVPVTVVEDCAVAHVMPRCQMVLCGAEAVVESGGVISKTGTYQMAIVAEACKRPFYVAAESTKFARMFPLSQDDLPKHETKREHAAFVGLGSPPNNLIAEKPSRDYTPPCYITLLFTDLGVLTPSAVSDELIKLFD